MSHKINPEQDNTLVEIGRIIHEDSYKREKKEISLEGMKIDLIKKEDGKYVICEIKKSSRFELSARMQLAYMLYKLKNEGIMAQGEVLFPKEKKKIEVLLTNALEMELENAITNIQCIRDSKQPPTPQKTKYCTKCAYYYFCWS